MSEYTTAVKILEQDDDKAVVGGYGVVFGGVDLEGETFTKDTDYWLDLVPTKPVFYDHSHNKNKSSDNPIGDAIKTEPDELGLWVEAEIDKSKQYHQAVLQLVEEGVLGWSSGTVGHLSRRDGKTITRWPIVEFSLTATPAEFRTIGVERIKALAESNPSLKALLPEIGQETDSEDATADGAEDAKDNHIGDKKMAENEVQVIQPDISGIEAQVEKISEGQEALAAKFTEAIDRLLAHAENSDELKDAGYIAPDSEADHAEAKSLGDWLLAVKNKNMKRLKEVYSTKAMSEVDGSGGGYLVPEQFENVLMSVAAENSIVRPRATVFPNAGQSGSIPALDVANAPSATGQTAYAGGVVASWGAESAALTETTPAFNLIRWEVNKLQGYTKVPNELIADSPMSIERLLSTLFGVAVASMEDYAFLQGTGAGMPLGVLKADCAIGVTTTTDNQFKIDDGVKMLGQFKRLVSDPVWVLNRGLVPDLEAYWQAGTAGVDFVQPREGIPGSLLGYPYLFSEHMPAANSDDALLADFGAYLIFDNQGLQIAYSEHAGFTNDQSYWRFTKRLDGQPWLRSYITQADSLTISPFVYHND